MSSGLIKQLCGIAFSCFQSYQKETQHQNQQGNAGQHQQQQGHGGYGQQQHAYPPQSQPSYPGSSGHGGARPTQGGHHQSQTQAHRPNAGGYGQIVGPGHSQDPNMVNQSNAKYVALRDSARHEGDLAQKCFAQSQNAYQAGDGARAHELSEQGKQHQARKRQIDGEARDWIYYQNNTDSSPGEVDLHGLFVKEAVEKAEQAIAERQRRGDREVRFIVGKGNHSVNHVAKIRPAIEDLMDKYDLDAALDPHNSGVLVVQLQSGGNGGLKNGHAGGNGRARGRALGSELESKNGECTIM